MRKICILFIFTVSLLCGLVVNTNACAEKPGVVDCQKSQLGLIFGNGDETECGQKASKIQYEKTPTVNLKNVSGNKRYALIMVDPDAPSPNYPINKYWLHWLVTDIEGEALRAGYNGVGSGDELMSYHYPHPPFGIHRYQFYVAEQPPGQTFKSPTTRRKFDLDGFLTKNNLCIVASSEYVVDSRKSNINI